MSTMNLLWHLTSTVLLWMWTFVESADPNQYSRGVDWLSRYGYLPPPDPKLGRLQSKEGIEQAIREMQRFGGIEQTGKLDEKTLALMSKPRCSLPDIMGSEDVMKRRRRRKRYALSEQKWGKEKITWSLSNKPTRSRNLNDPETVKTIMGYALKPWRDVTPLEFQEVEAHRGAEADLEISFDRAHHDDGYPFDGRGGTLAHAFFPGESRISGNTHFDDDEEWGFQDTSGQSTDLFTVAVHEFGHALGLGHSAVSGSIMAPYYAGPATRDIRSYRLPQDDTQGIQQLYGPRDPKSPNLPNPGLPDLPKPPPPHGTPVPDPTVKDRCGGSFDAVANIRGEVFFFKGKFFWRREHSGSLLSLAPAEIKNFWIGLPDNNQKIDAVYERSDSKIIFFSGSNYWVFENTKALPGYPRHISDWGMKHSDGRPVTSVEAAFVWAHNGRTFLFSGGEFWGFSNGKDIQLQGPDEGYPKGASLWKGMPSHPDDIISYREGNTYFFKGNSFWKIEKGRLDQEEVKEESTAIEWMKCDKGAVPTRPPGKEDCVCNITGSSADEWSRATFQSVVLIAVMILVQLL
ncbi:matrix metalloproteinase-25 [Engraulis encrasicolus]|uniref:matrix metalloproteinase-25 n=1 Tax=Engraulis encrasicolus TaxID=184585 RepID=UPI002FD6922C